MKQQLEQDLYESLSPAIQEMIENMTFEELKQFQKDSGSIPEDK